MVLAQAAQSGAAGASTVFAILASAVIVLGGLAALVRAIWKTASTLRDNTIATKNLTARLDDMASATDGRLEKLEQRMGSLEGKESRRDERERNTA